jgi:hypothetical protein
MTLARELYTEQIEHINKHLSESENYSKPKIQFLNELSLGVDVKDVIQFALAAAAEYGIDVSTLGIGAPAGFAADTVVDALFTGTDIISGINGLSSIANEFQKGKNILNAILASRDKLKEGFTSFYRHIKSIWTNIQRFFPEAVGNLRELMRDVKEEFKTVLEQVAKRIANLIGQALKLVIPDATVGAGVATAIKTLLVNLSENAYTVLTTIIGRSDALTNFITNPESAKSFFERMYDAFVQLMQQMRDKVAADEGWSLRRGVLGILGGAVGAAYAASPLGRNTMINGLNWLIRQLTEKRSTFLSIIQNIFEILLPTLFALLATHQILMKDDFGQSLLSRITGSGSETQQSESEQQQTTQEVVLRKNRLQLLSGIVK